MEALALKLLEELNSSVFVLLAILILSFFGMWKLALFTGKWTEKLRHHDTRLDKIDTISDKVIRLETKVDLIYQNTQPNRVVGNRSPLFITDLGKEIMAKIDGEGIFKKYSKQLSGIVEEAKAKNAYDIQIQSMATAKEKMVNIINEEELNLIKQEAFERGTLVEDLMGLFGILLRNHILAEKGIPIHEVDRHEPKP